MSRLSKEHKAFKKLIESAYSGGDDALANIIQGVGFIHPDNGVKQKAFEGIFSRHTLIRWEKENGLPTKMVGRAKYYPIWPFIKFIVDRSLQNKGSDANEDLKKWTLTEAEFKAKERQLKFEKEAGNYIPVEDVKRGWCEHISACRRRLLAIPRAMATRLQGETKRATIEKELRLEIYSALEELSE